MKAVLLRIPATTAFVTVNEKLTLLIKDKIKENAVVDKRNAFSKCNGGLGSNEPIKQRNALPNPS